jgi:hypothetical protein
MNTEASRRREVILPGGRKLAYAEFGLSTLCNHVDEVARSLRVPWRSL